MSAPADSLLAYLSIIEDPRAADNQRHRLVDILTIALCTALCGQDSFVAMAEFARLKLGWLRTFLLLPGGAPSHDTFRAVLSAIDPKQLIEVMVQWTESVRQKLGRPEIVAIDGKTARRSAQRAGGTRAARAALHLVNAWATDSGLCLGQQQTQEKSNEITAVPLLLRQLELRGCIVTLDALNTQKNIAKEIKEADAEYVLALKGNHPELKAEVESFFADARARHFAGVAHDFCEQTDKGHGRVEVRRAYITEEITWLEPVKNKEWEGLRSLGLIERERHDLLTGAKSVEKAFFLCSLGADAKEFARAVRGHWGVENALHWRLDVLFSEDQSRARTGFAAANLAALRKLALNAARAERSNPQTKNKSLRMKLFGALLDDAYRLELLHAHFCA
jgi:predicted transposase YbfD/YdcC